jgi:hypothetical protein
MKNEYIKDGIKNSACQLPSVVVGKKSKAIKKTPARFPGRRF